MMNDEPHALAPSMLASHLPLNTRYVAERESWSYSLTMMARPAPWETVSHSAQGVPERGKPKPNGSTAACAAALFNAFLMSVSNAALVTSSPGGSPAWVMARYRS